MVATKIIEKGPSLTQLVLAAQRGDRQSLGEIHQHFQVAIHKAIRRQYLNESDAQEIGQEVSLQAARSLGSLRDPACIGAWLRTIASRLATHRAAKRAELQLIDPHISLANLVSADGSPLDHLIEKERYEAVHAAFSHLAPMHRRILRSFYFDQHSLSRISKIERIPVGTVKSRLYTARKKLASRLESLNTA